MNNLPINTILQGDALEQLKTLPSESVHCIVTSPPYWGLRDYGVIGQLGLERTPQEYIQNMVVLFEECRRVLRKDGTLWLNIGDSYAAAPKNRTSEQAARKSTLNGSKGTQISCAQQPNNLVGLQKPKDLVGIPWMLAFALRDAGWYLRQDIIWHKPNPMPESVTDRCTKSHEYIFLLSKCQKYYYDHIAIKTESKNPDDDERRFARQNWENKNTPDNLRNGIRPRKSGNIERKDGASRGCPEGTGSNVCGSVPWEGVTSNKRSVWSTPTKPFSEAHFATYPPELIIDCIKAATSEFGCCASCGNVYKRDYTKTLLPTAKASYNSQADKRDIAADAQDQGSNRMKDGHKPGWFVASETKGWVKTCKCDCDNVLPAIVLDPFFGAGTTGVVARKLNRNYIGIELNAEYITIAENRLKKELGLFE